MREAGRGGTGIPACPRCPKFRGSRRVPATYYRTPLPLAPARIPTCARHRSYPFCSLRTRQLASFRLALPGLENHPLPQLADGVLDCDTLHSTDASFASPEVTPKSDKIHEGRF